MKKRVLFLIDSLNCGGAEKSLVSLLPLLDREKYSIDLWVLHRGGVFESLVPEWVHFIKEPRYDVLGRILRGIGQFFYSVSHRILRLGGKKMHGAEVKWRSLGFAYKVPEQEYDVAVAYQQGFPTYLAAKKVKAKKLIAWINADIFEVGYNVPFNLSFYERFDRIVPVSKSLKAKIEVRIPKLADKLECVFDVLNPELIRALSGESVSDIPSNGGNVTFVTVGRMVALKGYDVAVDAASILKKRGLCFRWLFVGDGPERQAIQSRIDNEKLSDSVFIMGMKPNPYPYMQVADIYVQTSRFEGFGMTVGEAKILYKPIVSTNFDVIYDQLTDGVNGLVVEKNAEAVADGIWHLVQDCDLRERIIHTLKSENNHTVLTEVIKVEKMLDED